MYSILNNIPSKDFTFPDLTFPKRSAEIEERCQPLSLEVKDTDEDIGGLTSDPYAERSIGLYYLPNNLWTQRDKNVVLSDVLFKPRTDTNKVFVPIT